MTKESERFVAFGFVKKGVIEKEPVITVNGKKIKLGGKLGEEKLKVIREKRKEFEDKGQEDKFDAALEAIADHEWAEVSKDQVQMTDFPKSISRYYMGQQSHHNSIEPFYFWCMNFLGDIGFPVIDKITDSFTAAEHSSFYGAGAQRLGLAQDKVSQYLASIGKMIKDMFQLVRELRWIDERLEVYRGAIGVTKEGRQIDIRKGDEQALKGLWVDLVDGVVGGQRTGSNLFMMAQQLQFTALPDLFFSVYLPKKDKLEGAGGVMKIVEDQAGQFNKQVRQLLTRKLVQYHAWKYATYDEMRNRRKFTMGYLRQHYQVIRMYINWIKPYIRHIERLSGQQDLLNNPRLIAAFETSLVEIEVLARMKAPGAKKYFTCILMTFEYSTQPSMQYTGDGGYHRGPIHVGSTRITWRSYSWDKDTINRYITMRRREDLELLSSIDKSLTDAMDSLGDDLMNYLEESEKGKKEEKEEKLEKPPLEILEPFTAVGKGLKEVFGSLVPELPKITKKKGKKDTEGPQEIHARRMCWLHYNIFKKAHGLLAW